MKAPREPDTFRGYLLSIPLIILTGWWAGLRFMGGLTYILGYGLRAKIRREVK